MSGWRNLKGWRKLGRCSRDIQQVCFAVERTDDEKALNAPCIGNFPFDGAIQDTVAASLESPESTELLTLVSGTKGTTNTNRAKEAKENVKREEALQWRC